MRYSAVVFWLTRIMFWSLIWLILAEGKTEKLWLGGLFVLAALVSSAKLGEPLLWAPVSFFRFLPFFLIRSFAGGLDVALKAFSPLSSMDPGLEGCNIKPAGKRETAFLAMLLGLLPGTVTVRIKEGALLVHFLDRRANGPEEVARVQEEVAKLYSDSITGRRS